MEIDAYIAAMQAAETARAEAIQKIGDQYEADLRAAFEKRESALSKVTDASLKERDDLTAKFDAAREAERENAVQAANEAAGLDKHGKEKSNNGNGPEKRAIKVPAP